MGIYLIFFGLTLASWWVQNSLSKKFSKYGRIPLSHPMSGRDVAIAMLRSHGINDVIVTSVAGDLTDHFNPMNRTVNLSQSVYATNSIAAAAVAAHECGHAVQHQVGYSMLRLRSALVPAVSFASQWVSWVILGGIILLQVFVFPYLLLLGIAMFAITALFSLVTLPVEVDASRRAMQWLELSGITQGESTAMAKDALRAAAYTYVIAALGSLATVIYYLLLFMGSRR
ncbi:MAG: zinc metallopeptidase [Muribaculaceae bacterium]|nr:zinc metallopeptidase [Muribaculaceae bacterium]